MQQKLSQRNGQSPKMWKKSKSWNNPHSDRTVVLFEDRPHLGGTKPRVSFRARNRQNREISRNLVLASLDDDIPMIDKTNNNTRQGIMRDRGRDTSRGRNSPPPNRNFRGRQFTWSRPRQLPLGESNSYRIIIPYGHKYEKDYILRTLLNYLAPEIFVPIMYKVMRREARFYVDDRKTATALVNCDRAITLTDRFKLQIRAMPGFPLCEINDRLKNRLKQAMVKRYVQETNALNLSKFHRDPDLVDDYFCALCHPPMFMVILEIVTECVPMLEALNLEGNKLHITERFNVLSRKLPRLKILYLGDNNIRDIKQLDVIKDLKLEDLRLIGNPVCNKYKFRQTDYVSDVQKRFPKLLRLDDSELPRPITAEPVTLELNEEIKQQMILMLCQQTNMNLAWSFKCLQEVQWNYNNAFAAFQHFYKRGEVPPEAFVK